MIFTLIIKCVEGAYLQEPFKRTIEVPDDMTLGELHNTIQELTGFEASIEGNFGVGSILVNEGGNIVVQGHNEVFSPYFRSDRHAEMVVMDAFEDARRAPGGLDRFTLYTSLEPCPMCLIRLSTSDIGRVLFATRDIPGGMVHRMNELPPFWIELAQRKIFQQAACSPNLMEAANEIFRLNLDALTEKIKAAYL